MSLVEHIAQQFPDARIEVDGPIEPGGAFFLNVIWSGRHVAVEYRPSQGYGVSAGDDLGFGQGPDEVFTSVEDVERRVRQLLREGGMTEPIRGPRLRELRERRQVTQTELARLLGTGQAAISKLERREDLSLKSLRRFVEALGGTLEVTARFSDGTFAVVGETAK